jgi:adenylate cyclase
MFPFLRRFRQRSSRLIFTPQHPWRRLRGGLVVGVIVGGWLALMLWQNLFVSYRTQLTDTLYSSRPTSGITAIVAIDDQSLAAYGRSPTEWPRSVHTQLVNFLSQAGARVIAFDVLFANPTQYDTDLATAMTNARDVVEPTAGIWTTSKQTTQRGQFIQFDTYQYPTPVLRDAAALIGHVNIVPDGDGQVRQVPLVVKNGDQYIPALGLAAILEYLNQSSFLQVSQGHVTLPARDLVTDDIGQMLIYFFGPPTNVGRPGTYPVYSLVDVVEGRVSPDVFKGKIVLIGALDATGEPDSYATPSTSTGQKMYGVEIHANIIETIYQSWPDLPLIHNKIDWRLNLGPLGHLQIYRGTASLPLHHQSQTGQILVTFLLAVVVGALLPFLRWYIGLLLIVVGIVVVIPTWATVEFRVWGRVEEMLFPSMALGMTFVGTMIVIYVFEERRRGQINDLFSRYVSAEIATKIVEAFDRGQLELGGEEREITVMFADVRGFTTLSEGLTPPEVVRILNVFLEQMTSIVMRYGGAVNKYIGDNMMAFWNAPYTQEDHAWLATQAALDILEAIRKVNETGQFLAPVQFGIGINTGPVVVGNVGSQRRLEYTPIGDTVNVASRLCGVAPGGICYIGARTRELLGDRVRPTAVLHLKLKGKAEPVEVHELRPPSSVAATLPSMRMEDIIKSGGDEGE